MLSNLQLVRRTICESDTWEQVDAALVELCQPGRGGVGIANTKRLAYMRSLVKDIRATEHGHGSFFRTCAMP